MSKYLGMEIGCNKTGDFEDLIAVFHKYYFQINMMTKVREMTVIRNLTISEEVDLARKNLAIFVGHTRQSMVALVNRERIRFYNATKEGQKESQREVSKEAVGVERRHGNSVDNEEEPRSKGV